VNLLKKRENSERNEQEDGRGETEGEGDDGDGVTDLQAGLLFAQHSVLKEKKTKQLSEKIVCWAFGFGQLTSFMFILSCETGFY
jgi:hypothetical protein